MKRFFTLCVIIFLIVPIFALCSCDIYENNSSGFNTEDKESTDSNKEYKEPIETTNEDRWYVEEYINSIENLMLAIRDWDAFCELDYISDPNRIDIVKTNLDLLVKCPFPYIENYSDFYIGFNCANGSVTVCFTTTDGTDYSFLYLFGENQAYVDSNSKFGELQIGTQQIEMFSLTNSNNSSYLANVKEGIWENSGTVVLISAYRNDLDSTGKFQHFYTVDLIKMASEYDFSD